MASRYPSTPECCDDVERLLRKAEQKCGPLGENMRRELAQAMRDKFPNINISPFQSFSLNDSPAYEDIQSSIFSQLGVPQEVRPTGGRENGPTSQAMQAPSTDRIEQETLRENVTSPATSHPTRHQHPQGEPLAQNQLAAPGAVGGARPAGAKEFTASAPQLMQGSSAACGYCWKNPSRHFVRPVTDGGKDAGRYDDLHVLHERPKDDEENA